MIVIGIPTFRRLRLLGELLDSLLPEIGTDVTIIVADNDCSSEAKALVEGSSSPSARILYVAVPERGLTPVRNALVATATEHVPAWRWLAMLDDDGLVTPGWLSEIVACGERFEADLVGGPVIGVLPENASIFARNSIFAQRRRWPTGIVDTLNTTQNLLISRTMTTLLAQPLFRQDYSASGGEDYDLFRRSAQAGARIVWCDEAVIREPAPVDRLTLAGLMSRYYTTGIYMSKIDRSYDGRISTWKVAVGGMAGAIVRTMRFGIARDANAAARGVMSIGHYAGRLVGMLGGSTARYVKDSKES